MRLKAATKKAIEQHRETWAKIARERGWHFEPFHIQVWVNAKGEVVDSVAHLGMKGRKGDIVEVRQ